MTVDAQREGRRGDQELDDPVVREDDTHSSLLRVYGQAHNVHPAPFHRFRNGAIELLAVNEGYIEAHLSRRLGSCFEQSDEWLDDHGDDPRVCLESIVSAETELEE